VATASFGRIAIPKQTPIVPLKKIRSTPLLLLPPPPPQDTRKKPISTIKNCDHHENQ